MPACLDCGFFGDDDAFPSLTEEQVREHFENGGFDSPESALEKVGAPYCPECDSDQLTD